MGKEEALAVIAGGGTIHDFALAMNGVNKAKSIEVLKQAAINKDRVDIVEFLFSFNRDIRDRGDRGETFLEIAAHADAVSCLRFLSEKFPKTINTCEPGGKTVLLIAVMRRNPGMVRILIDNGAELFVNDNDHGVIAAAEDEPEIKQMIDKLLKEHLENVEATNNSAKPARRKI